MKLQMFLQVFLNFFYGMQISISCNIMKLKWVALSAKWRQCTTTLCLPLLDIRRDNRLAPDVSLSTLDITLLLVYKKFEFLICFQDDLDK